ncbi:hypothetical protein NMY22_g13177 [Coprinellus aureogranulatus]|nr:hypothetical protein NMY22_g13177 [Coprinellus aureogranulatus]
MTRLVLSGSGLPGAVTAHRPPKGGARGMGAFDTSLGALLIGAFRTFFEFCSYDTSNLIDPKSSGLQSEYVSIWPIDISVWIVLEYRVQRSSLDKVSNREFHYRSRREYFNSEYPLEPYFASILRTALRSSTTQIPLSSQVSIPLEKAPVRRLRSLTTTFPFRAGLAPSIQHDRDIHYRVWRTKLPCNEDISPDGSPMAPIPLLSLSTATLIFGFVYGVKITMSDSFLDILALRKELTVWLSLEVALDTSISAVLFTAIQRSRTGFKRSDAVLNRLARSAIQSGVFTSILAILALVCFSALDTTLFYATFGMPCARAYTISLLDTLVCRKDLRALMRDSDTRDGFGMTSIPDIFSRQSVIQTPTATWQMQIRKEVQTEVTYETRTRTSESGAGDLVAKPPSLFVQVK